MGVVDNIRHDKFPVQGAWLNKRVSVCFNYDTSPDKRLEGKIVRDDRQEPFITIIALDNGTYLLTTECQFQILPGQNFDT